MSFEIGPFERLDFGNQSESFLCPTCNVLSLHLLQEPGAPIEYELNAVDPEGRKTRSGIKRRHLIYQCAGCQAHTYYLIQRIAVPQKNHLSPFKVITHILHQFPITNPSIHSSVPVEVKNAMSEAERCLAVHASNACGAMARRAMSALCQDKGAVGTDLYKQLLDLKDRHLITPDLYEWAEELRIVGRSGAHPEWEDVTQEDADYAVKFLREIIKYVYINPAERSERKLKETKKKK
jgi:hypothetical protein